MKMTTFKAGQNFETLLSETLSTIKQNQISVNPKIPKQISKESTEYLLSSLISSMSKFNEYVPIAIFLLADSDNKVRRKE